MGDYLVISIHLKDCLVNCCSTTAFIYRVHLCHSCRSFVSEILNQAAYTVPRYKIRVYFQDINLLLVDPVVLSRLPWNNFALLEPESNLLFSILDAVRAMTDIPSNIDAVVPSYCAGCRSKGVRGTEESWRNSQELDPSFDRTRVLLTTTSLDGITTFPYHGADGSASHIYQLLDVNHLWSPNWKGVHLTSPGKNGLEERSSSLCMISDWICKTCVE